jgi:hypothetical protein
MRNFKKTVTIDYRFVAAIGVLLLVIKVITH